MNNLTVRVETPVAIIGGGLSGLALARELARAKVPFQLFEARNRFGGRILRVRHENAGIDLGPSWFWPGQQRMARMVEHYGLHIHEQFARGAVSYQSETGEVSRNVGFSSMQGSLRVKGGMSSLVEAIVADLPAGNLHLGMAAVEIGEGGLVRFENGAECIANTVVVAAPPRVAAKMKFAPNLDDAARMSLHEIPTWMGGHAKFVAIFERPFWRDQGLSGDAMSRFGPLAEIHDATDANSSQHGALFGFMGVPASVRAEHGADIKRAALAQLTQLFGPEAAHPLKVVLQDWAFEPFTSSNLDHAAMSHHPSYGKPQHLNEVWGGRLQFCATELAPEMGGYLEGALAAAQDTAAQILEQLA